MSEVTAQVERAMRDHQLVSTGDRVLVGVSGGVDSMVLLHLLVQMAPAKGLELVIAHFNHQLRGRSSDADERLVCQTARALGRKIKVGCADVRRVAKREGISIEMAARQCRHAFLARTAKELQIEKIALAHHADDQVELFFLRLLRGTGAEGLSGMKRLSPSPADSQLTLIRPLLDLTRSEIEAYAQQQGIRFRTDASNEARDHERNRIRHELLPLLREQFQPAVSATVSRLIRILGAESDYIAGALQQARSAPSTRFDALHVSLQRRWLQAECLEHGVTPDFELIERLRSQPGRPWMVNPELVVWREEDGRVRTRRESLPLPKDKSLMVDLERENKEVQFGESTIAWRIAPWNGTGFNGVRDAKPHCERFDADKAGSRVVLRHWRAGDRFQPIGMPTPIKVQDLLTNLKVPRARRHTLILAATAAGEIFWIEGMRIAEAFKLTPQTSRCLEWCWRSGK